MNKATYILIEKTSLYRAESRYKKAYGYAKVAQRHADRINASNTAAYKSKLKGGYAQYATKPEKVIVVSESDYAQMIKGKGEWKTAILGGGKVWVAFDTPACCDPSTETYACM